MNPLTGTWIDQDGVEITSVETNKLGLLSYSNGRGPFTALQVNLASPVINVDFNDGTQPDAGYQTGLMNFSKDQITWSNDTVWNKQ
mgnify:CR=1 FL=1